MALTITDAQTKKIVTKIRDDANELLELTNLREQGSIDVKTIGSISFSTSQRSSLTSAIITLLASLEKNIGIMTK